MSVGSFRPFLAASLVLLASARIATGQAQTGTISGTVTGEIGQPIGGAQVALVGTGLGTLTTRTGNTRSSTCPPRSIACAHR